VELTATAVSGESAAPPQGARRITDHLWLAVLDKTALEEDVHHMEFGLRQVADAIGTARPEQVVVIQLDQLTYPLTDYQPEAAAAAIAGWAAEEFGFAPPDIAVTFDRTTGYTLTWPSDT
jgi:hypothetical protein